jgi:CheY-like chemotaxis protein
MRGALEREGYTIVEAKDGAEALSICEQNPAIGLIVSDLAMPQMTGLELRERVAVMRPNMKFLLISGYVKDVVVSPEQVAKFAEFLEKPFRPNELTQKVRELLTRTNGKQEEARGGNTLPAGSHDKSGPENDPRLN